jgi:hypothetical protein
MNQETIAKIAKLLAETGAAHHLYEQTALKGVYDQEWPAWYAEHLLELKLNDLLNHPVTQADLSNFLFQSNEVRKQQRPEPDWVGYTAHDIAARL